MIRQFLHLLDRIRADNGLGARQTLRDRQAELGARRCRFAKLVVAAHYCRPDVGLNEVHRRALVRSVSAGAMPGRHIHFQAILLKAFSGHLQIRLAGFGGKDLLDGAHVCHARRPLIKYFLVVERVMPHNGLIGLRANKLRGTCHLRDLICTILPLVVVLQMLRRHNIGCVLA